MTGVQFLGWVFVPLLVIIAGSILMVGPWLFYLLYVPLFIASVAMMSWRCNRTW